MRGGKFPDLVFWGDSLTNGTGASVNPGTTYRDVAANYGARKRWRFNCGVGGETSTQIAVRQGGTATTATISGGTIPASGSVTVTFPTGYEPCTSQGPFQDLTNTSTPTIFGTLAGVYGTITYAAGPVYTFNRLVAGSAVSAASAQFFPDNSQWTKATACIWAGINNSGQTSQIQSDVQGMINALTHNRFLVMSIITGGSQNEWIGAPGYNTIMNSDNPALQAIAGNRYVDVHTPLVAGYNPANPVDVLEHANNTVSFTLRARIITGSLTQNIGTSDTSFTISTTGLSTGYVLDFGSGEYAYVSSQAGNTVTVTRGYGGSPTFSYSSGQAYTAVDPRHLADAGYAIVGNTVGAALASFNF